MFPSVISDSNHVSESHIMSSSISPRLRDFVALNSILISNNNQSQLLHPQKSKKKRNLPGNPDPDAEVIALSPKTLLATNRFVCEICNKGFQRDQNLQLHRRGHNLPWKLKQRSSKEMMKKRAYVCPESTCLHHHPSRALGDLTGIKKHYCRKHGEKKWKCDKCSKIYAVQSDWKAHGKTCGTREYRCDCGTLFSRKDSFITHRAFCDALAEESARLSATNSFGVISPAASGFHFNHQPAPPVVVPPLHLPFSAQNPNPNPLVFDINGHSNGVHNTIKHEPLHIPIANNYQNDGHMIMSSSTMMMMPPLSATALLQRAGSPGPGQVGSTMGIMAHLDMHAWRDDDERFTRDFMGLTGDQGGVGDQMLTFTGGVKFPAGYDGYGFTGGDQACSGWGNC